MFCLSYVIRGKYDHLCISIFHFNIVQCKLFDNKTYLDVVIPVVMHIQYAVQLMIVVDEHQHLDGRANKDAPYMKVPLVG